MTFLKQKKKIAHIKISFNDMSVFHSVLEVIKMWTLVTRTALNEWCYYIVCT